MESFRNKYLPLILALQNDPLASIKDIAEKIDLSWPTAKKRYEEALEEGIITRVIANFDSFKLGFRRHFILADLSDYRALQIVEELCDHHPYTIYRSRIIGSSGISLFMIFQIPHTLNADNNLKDFFLILYREKIIDNYFYYSSTGWRIDTKFNLDYFDMGTEQWNFDPETWLSKLGDRTEEPQRPHETLDLEQFNTPLLYILRLMTDNLIPTQKEIKAAYEEQYEMISRSEFHRQFTFLRNEVIRDTELIYDYSQFGISEHYLYILPNLTQNEINQFFGLVKHHPPPLKFSVEAAGQNNIVLWGNMPANLARELSFHLWKKFSQTRSYTFTIEKGWAMRYLFYHENFDDENKRWKDDYHYMVEEPLKFYRNTH